MLNKIRRHNREMRFGHLALFTFVMCWALVSPTAAKTIEDIIPADTFFYLELQHLAACREAIESSTSWEYAAELIAANPKWSPINQMLQMVPIFTGTDIPGLLDTLLGDRVGLTVSAAEEGLLIGLVIQNAGKASTAEQTFATLTETLTSMGTNVNVEKGTYRDIAYHTAQLGGQQLTYGSLSTDLFIAGLNPASFKKLIDVYHAETASIATSDAYRSVVEKAEESEVLAFIDVTVGGPYLQLLLPPVIGRELAAFRTLGYTWHLLQPGHGHRLYGHLNLEQEDALIPRLRAEKVMQTTRGLAGNEEFFLALPQEHAALLWQAILNALPPSENSNFLFPPKAVLQAALAGELTCNADLTNITQYLLGFATNQRSTAGVINAVGFDFKEHSVGFLFKPDTPETSQTVFQGILEKCAVASRRQVDYKGIVYNVVDIPGSFYSGKVNDLFLLAFSEQQFQTMVDNLLAGPSPDGLQQRFAAFSALPAAYLQLDFGELIGALAATNPQLSPEMIAFLKQMGPLLAALAVQEETFSLHIAHEPEETGSEAMAKLAPFVFFMFTEDKAAEQ